MPTKPKAPCRVCSALTPCPHRLPPGKRLYDNPRWKKLSRVMRQRQPWCSWCGATNDLTLDHIKAGSLEEGVQVLCRQCNGKKG